MPAAGEGGNCGQVGACELYKFAAAMYKENPTNNITKT